MLAYNIKNWKEAPGTREAHLVVTRETSRRRARERIRRICRVLGERETPRICHAIGEVTRELGFARTHELVEEARAIFAGPGMLVRNGSRRRTLGGIFFQLASAARHVGAAETSAEPA